jgi:sugar transferase (PEP-CTERM/EpsH1 system associated)
LVSEAEAELFRRFCGPGRVEAVTNGVDLEYFQPQNRANRDGCVFLGALDYRPNVEGITWFCREVWPLVLQVRPDARIRLVGRRPTSTIKSLARLPGVELIGQVPDVRPFVAGANVAVVPLQIARGVQNKILESLAMEVATVVSPSCLKGLRAQPGKHLLVASSAKEWVEVVQHLLEDRDLGNELGRAGRDYVMQHHRWDQCLRPMDALLDLPAPPTTIEALGCGDASNAALATAGRQ